METLVTKKVSVVLLSKMEIQERILRKTTELFMRYGIRSITMDEIAIQLGISKKTIYQFYEDKNELVDAVIKQLLTQNCDRCEADKAVADNAIHEVFLAIDMMMEMFANMNPSVLHDLEKYHPKAYEKFSDFKYKFLYRIIKENLEKGLQEGLYRPDFDTGIITVLRLESVMLPFTKSVFSKKFHLAEVHQQVMEHFLFGIASLKGYHLIVKYKEERKKY